MTILTPKQQKIAAILLERGQLGSSEIHKELVKAGEKISLVTIKRALSDMAASGFLKISGSGRSTAYAVLPLARIFSEIDAASYTAVDPDKRHGLAGYNFDLLPAFPPEVFTDDELAALDSATAEYNKRIKDLPAAIQKKEMERLIIELSWKSSKIEGNTYTLLDTEKLILENRKAPGKTQKEAQMILNHKDAFNFIHENSAFFKTLNRANLEKLHGILVKSLTVGLGFREKPVGVVGSKYRPLDNLHQIREAVEALGSAVGRMNSPYARAFIALLGISYIQPFEDGNKRTSRLAANALLMAHGLAPLSYRSVEESEYREAMLVFYELNSIMPFKKIFVSQYEFAARNYAVK